jgi:hypothetical protein
MRILIIFLIFTSAACGKGFQSIETPQTELNSNSNSSGTIDDSTSKPPPNLDKIQFFGGPQIDRITFKLNPQSKSLDLEWSLPGQVLQFLKSENGSTQDTKWSIINTPGKRVMNLSTQLSALLVTPNLESGGLPGGENLPFLNTLGTVREKIVLNSTGKKSNELYLFYNSGGFAAFLITDYQFNSDLVSRLEAPLFDQTGFRQVGLTTIIPSNGSNNGGPFIALQLPKEIFNYLSGK